jgi:sigma-B regulation protein RsbU (phosphoserine phosphatase)
VRLERALAEHNRTLESANERMKRDLAAAAKVQQSILPVRMPDLPHVTGAWRYEPCDELAGDALNVLALDERFLLTYVLDVSGHGVPAALLSVAVARALAPSSDPSSIINSSRGDCGFGRFAAPADVATRLNERFQFEANGRRFFTMIYCLFDLETSRLTFCCAGHPGPIRVTRDGEVDAIEAPGIIVGITPDPDYENTSVDLRPGDRFYFYSDGIIEQASVDAELFGGDRLCDVLVAARGGTLPESVDSVVATLCAWAHRGDFDDDLSLIGIEWRGPGGGDPDARASHG